MSEKCCNNNKHSNNSNNSLTSRRIDGHLTLIVYITFSFGKAYNSDVDQKSCVTMGIGFLATKKKFALFNFDIFGAFSKNRLFKIICNIGRHVAMFLVYRSTGSIMMHFNHNYFSKIVLE